MIHIPSLKEIHIDDSALFVNRGSVTVLIRLRLNNLSAAADCRDDWRGEPRRSSSERSRVGLRRAPFGLSSGSKTVESLRRNSALIPRPPWRTAGSFIVNSFIFPSNGLMYDLKDSWCLSPWNRRLVFFKLISVQKGIE